MFALLLTFALGAQLKPQTSETGFLLPCESRTVDNCNGPLSSMPGHSCWWDGKECETLDPFSETPERKEKPELEPHNPEEICKSLTYSVTACQKKQGCYYQDFECKSGVPESHPEPWMPQQQPVMPGMPPHGAPFPGHKPVHPGQNGPHGMQPVNVFPGAPPPPGSQQPFFPGAPGNHPVDPPLLPGVPTPSQPGPTKPVEAPKHCERLPKEKCFGPSFIPNEVCFFDEEDLECSSQPKQNLEKICQRFDQDPNKCNEHESCFWDPMEGECEANKFDQMQTLPEGMVESTCTENLDVASCARKNHCFWEATGAGGVGVCVNVVQATNVCLLYTTPLLCSTNKLCHWTGEKCQTWKGLLRKEHLTKGNVQQPPPTNQSNDSSSMAHDFLLAFICSILGLGLGLTIAWTCSKLDPYKPSNDDYRDISMDDHSRSQSVVRNV